MYRKGPDQPATLGYLGHVLMENRHALAVGMSDFSNRDGGTRGPARDGGGSPRQSTDALRDDKAYDLANLSPICARIK